MSGIYGWQAMVISSPDTLVGKINDDIFLVPSWTNWVTWSKILWWHVEIQPPLLERISWSNGRLIFSMEFRRPTILWTISSLGVTTFTLPTGGLQLHHHQSWWSYQYPSILVDALLHQQFWLESTLLHQHWWSFLFTINNCGDNLHLHHGPSFCTNYDYGHLTRKHFCYQVTKLQLNLQLWNLDDPQVQEGVEVGRSLFLPKQHICGWVCKLWISHQWITTTRFAPIIWTYLCQWSHRGENERCKYHVHIVHKTLRVLVFNCKETQLHTLSVSS